MLDDGPYNIDVDCSVSAISNRIQKQIPGLVVEILHATDPDQR